jgi:hypothetical protein
MAANAHLPRPDLPNRRARVRQKVHVPAYATFSAAAQGEMLDLYEVLDISECGIALHCSSPMEINQTVDLCLDLAEAGGQISCTARVAWLVPTGRVGFALPVLSDVAHQQLSEWLFLNALASAANAEPLENRGKQAGASVHLQNYTDTLSAASAVEREAESLGADLEAVLALVASRAQSLLRGAGAAIALEDKNSRHADPTATSRSMICRASSGSCAPPVGIPLEVGSGFSGECVRLGRLLRCHDSETDSTVDRQTCRALGIRSIIATPLFRDEKIIGLLEVFSPKANAFSENDGAVLQRLAETIELAVGGATPPSSAPPAPQTFVPVRGSVLFAEPPLSTPGKKLFEAQNDDPDHVGGIRLPRTHLYLLFAAAATIFLALGFLTEPWLQEKLQARDRGNEHTVLASSQPPAATPAPTPVSADSANFAQLRELASHNDAAAENALGLLYSSGDEAQGVKRDEAESARWFTKAAEDGSISAQSKLCSLYWGGRGVAKDDAQAYFWTVLARANGDQASKTLAPFIAAHLTPAQRSGIEQRAEQWLQRRESTAKPVAAR